MSTCRAKLGSGKVKHQVTIDTALVEPFNARLRSQYQFIGEVIEVSDAHEKTDGRFSHERDLETDDRIPQEGGEGDRDRPSGVKRCGRDAETAVVVVQARLVRNVDDLDLVMFEQALKAQRQYLKLRDNI